LLRCWQLENDQADEPNVLGFHAVRSKMKVGSRVDDWIGSKKNNTKTVRVFGWSIKYNVKLFKKRSYPFYFKKHNSYTSILNFYTTMRNNTFM